MEIDWKKVAANDKSIDFSSVDHIYGNTLLHTSCWRGEVAATITLLTCDRKISVNTQNAECNIPLYEATWARSTKLVEILLMFGSKTMITESPNMSPLFYSTCFNIETAKILVANGARIPNLSKPSANRWIGYESYTQASRNISKLIPLQRGVVNCRDVIVVLLGLKKRKSRHVVLPKLDRFLIQQVLAPEIWSTRCDEQWQK